MSTPREKSPLLEAQRRVKPAMLHHTGYRDQHTTNSAILASEWFSEFQSPFFFFFRQTLWCQLSSRMVFRMSVAFSFCQTPYLAGLSLDCQCSFLQCGSALGLVTEQTPIYILCCFSSDPCLILLVPLLSTRTLADWFPVFNVLL